jgi:hypothetical protein
MAANIPTVTKSGATAILTWTHAALSNASDAGCGGASRLSYDIERRLGTGGGWVLVINVTAATTTYTDTPGDGEWQYQLVSRERWYFNDA